MVVLSWLAIALLAVALTVYIVWTLRERDVPARWLRATFTGGILAFSAFFIVFTWHSLAYIPKATHADRLTPSVRAGKVAWQKYVCVDCHTILGNGAYYAPDLTKSWNRFMDRTGGKNPEAAKAALVAYLKHPPGATATRRGMPAYAMTDAEAAGLADFLRWTSEIDTNGFPPAPRRNAIVAAADAQRAPMPQGEQLFAARGCAGCHTFGGGPAFGPDLAASRLDRTMMARFIADPAKVYAQRSGANLNAGFPQMPDVGLTATEADAIADYLIRKRG